MLGRSVLLSLALAALAACDSGSADAAGDTYACGEVTVQCGLGTEYCMITTDAEGVKSFACMARPAECTGTEDEICTCVEADAENIDPTCAGAGLSCFAAGDEIILDCPQP